MTRHDLEILDTIGTPDYLKGELSDDGESLVKWIQPPLTYILQRLMFLST